MVRQRKVSGVRLHIADERWPLASEFRIARGAKTEAHVVTAAITQGAFTGRGECVPYTRYGETVDGVVGAIESIRSDIEQGAKRQDLLRLLKPGAARNALDCALWDLEAKQNARRAWDIAGLPEPQPAETAFTISLGEPKTAIHTVRSDTTFIVDPNEAWSFDQLKIYAPELKRLGVKLIEQPLPANADASLEGYDSPVPLCADESVHTASDLPRLAAKYSAINIKLDKTGGLTAALALAREAQ
ncbi:MAG: dipeptide epimerase, partial [Alphaproteobacteria bacterium]|nr:dipeptide epimerase [Alphaproteobacteria bacterium]